MAPEKDNRFEKFTKEAKQALIVAQEVARKTSTNYVGTEHILIGILSQPNSLGASILMNFGVSLDNVNLVLKSVGRTATSGSGKASTSGGGLSGFAKKVIEDAVKCAQDHSHLFVGTEHLLHALVVQDNTAATVILENMKVRPADIQREIEAAFENLRRSPTVPTGMATGAAATGQMNPLEFFLSGLQGAIQGGAEKEGSTPYTKPKPVFSQCRHPPKSREGPHGESPQPAEPN